MIPKIKRLLNPQEHNQRCPKKLLSYVVVLHNIHTCLNGAVKPSIIGIWDVGYGVEMRIYVLLEQFMYLCVYVLKMMRL